jgi:polyhydroxyalkanoate synthesis regulator phasin
MAKKRATPVELPDAVREAVDRTVQATVGSAQFTRERAQEAVDEVVRGAETRAGAVRQAVRGALEERRPATQEDMRDLAKELRSIARRLKAIEERLPPEPPTAAARKGAGGKNARRATGAPTKRSK